AAACASRDHQPMWSSALCGATPANRRACHLLCRQCARGIAMKVWQFSEQPYYTAWQSSGAMGITLPPRHCDPLQACVLLNRYLDDYILADELGLNIMVNEHHSTASCMSTSCMTTLAILARQTRKARLL